MTDAPIRIGILGAARIAPMALVRPAREVRGVSVTAIAARDPQRAQAFATKHGIPRVLASYEALVNDAQVDALYNPLPNSLHCEWTIRALQAGKHVLCEKPIASNATEAERMAEAARQSGRVLAEAFHWRYHPLATRMKAIIDSGEVGVVHHVEAHFCIPLLRPGDIRYQLALGGGATMDVGCYAINIVRFLAAAEPEVVRAEAKSWSPGIDRAMTADFRFADGRSGRISCALLSAFPFRASARVRGDRGTLSVFNPIVPHLFHRLTLRNQTGTRRERLRGDPTYTHQLRAFAAAIRTGRPLPTGPEDAIANMRIIDAVYAKAGLPLRGAASAG
jgi:predicted dehydrogenase